MHYARDGRLMQKSVWRDGKLRAAWERDEGRWMRVATAGRGRLRYFDQDGREFGFADYLGGDYLRGAH